MKRPGTSARPVSVLVVDDFPDAAASLALVLNLEGFAARAALSGEEAMVAATAEPPDVLVFEPRTRGGGWDLARRLVEPFAGGRAVLVALPTDGTTAGRQEADLIGVRGYLLKPESPRVLIDLLRGVAPERGRGVHDSETARPPRAGGPPS